MIRPPGTLMRTMKVPTLGLSCIRPHQLRKTMSSSGMAS